MNVLFPQKEKLIQLAEELAKKKFSPGVDNITAQEMIAAPGKPGNSARVRVSFDGIWPRGCRAGA